MLGAWKLENELQNYCDRTETLQPAEVTALQTTLERVEECPHQTHIHSLIVKHAKRRLSAELAKQVKFRGNFFFELRSYLSGYLCFAILGRLASFGPVYDRNCFEF